MSGDAYATCLAALGRLDTCTVSNAVETFGRRLRNEGFMDSGVRCLFPQLPPMVGHAAPIRIRTSSPPTQGAAYFDRTDLWDYILSLPAPRVLVAEDVDERPGFGALYGEVHANILQALGCVGLVTNGAVRDLPQVANLGFHFFARNPAVSHAFSHIVEFGQPVKVAGLAVKPGELLHGDAHGVLSIPAEIACDVPLVAALIREREQRVIDLCRRGSFTQERLRAELRGIQSEHS